MRYQKIEKNQNAQILRLNRNILRSQHGFHLVAASPWPFLVSFSLFCLLFGSVLFLHSYAFGGYLLVLGFLQLSYNLLCWWHDIVIEATFEGNHTEAVQNGLRCGVVLFIIFNIRIFRNLLSIFSTNNYFSSLRTYPLSTLLLGFFIFFWGIITFIYCPFFRDWMFIARFIKWFKQPATPVLEGIMDFHNDILLMLIPILFIVAGFLVCIVIYNFRHFSGVFSAPHNTVLEIIWTVIPIVLLIATVIPSFGLLYAMNDLIHPTMTVKAIANQWYWVYEYTDYIVNCIASNPSNSSNDGEVELKISLKPDPEPAPTPVPTTIKFPIASAFKDHPYVFMCGLILVVKGGVFLAGLVVMKYGFGIELKFTDINTDAKKE